MTESGVDYCEDVDMIHGDLVGDRFRMCVYLHAGGEKEEFDEAIIEWANTTKDTTISLFFDLPLVFDSMRDLHINSRSGEIDFDAKPLFDAFRRDLVSTVARIDELKFSNDH